MLEIRVLGTIEVIRDGVAAVLPPSRKTRALLAFLALTSCSHRREQLCELLWDVPDYPRGALRWSLSKIRPLVDEPAHFRLIADRQTVELRTERADIDFFAAQLCADDKTAATGDLARVASRFRGPLLADLDLPDQSGFHTWLLGLREDARDLQKQILCSLTERLGATPDSALPYARELVRADPFDETAWAQLIDTLANAGRIGEIRQQFEAGLRSLREIGGGSGPLMRAWRAAQASATRRGSNYVNPAQPVDIRPASIVVLPFANLSNDPEQQYFADGIAGNLMTDLSRIPDMFVISRNTAFTYRNNPIDTKQIGRELGVRYVLEGDVQRSGNQVRVTAQLIDAETDAHLWAERFTGNADDLFAVQDEITSRIAVALDLELVNAEALRSIDRPDTRDYIFRGRAERLKSPSRENRAAAIGLFERALALDQHSAAAQSWLAIALTARVLEFNGRNGSSGYRASRRIDRTSLGCTAPQYDRALRQGPGAAGATQIHRGYSRIRNRNCTQPELGARTFPSRLVQVHDRVNRGTDPNPGKGYPAQSSRSSNRVVLLQDRIGAYAAIAHRRGSCLVPKSTQCHSSTPGVSCVSSLGLCPDG